MARKSRYDLAAASPVLETEGSRAAGYRRLSVENGDDAEKNSLDNQKMIVEHFVRDRSDIVIVDYYTDNGCTGMNYNRPGFLRMMEDVRAGKIDCIIVKDISRFGRHFVMTTEYVERILPELGVRLICINDDYDSMDEASDTAALMLPLKIVMNDNYARDISKKIRSGITAKMNSGEFLPSSGSVPYGYLRNPKDSTFDIDPEAAEVVQRIFHMRAAGLKFNAMARILNGENIPCPGKLRYMRNITKAAKYENTQWTRGTIRKITGDQVYIGNRVHGKVKRDKLGTPKKRRPKEEWQIIEHAHPAVVSMDLFEQVQQVNQAELEARSHYEKRADVSTDYRDIFRGKVFCADCGRAMVAGKGCARPNAKTSSRIFYDCAGYRYSNHERCSSHYIRQEALMETLTHYLDKQVEIAVDLNRLMNQVRTAPQTVRYQAQADEKLLSARVRRQNVEARLEQLLVDLTAGIIDRDEYEYAKHQYTLQNEKLHEEEIKAEREAQLLSDCVSTTKSWIAVMKKYHRLPAIDRGLIDLLVKDIRVFGDKRIEISLNYADPYAPLLACMNKLKEAEKDAG